MSSPVYFGRRSFLSLGAAAVGGALLGPLTRRIVQGDSIKSRRFVFIVEGNCFEPVTLLSPAIKTTLEQSMGTTLDGQRWWYRNYNNESVLEFDTPDLASASALGALDQHQLREKAAVLYGLSSEIVHGGHSGLHGALSSSRTIGGVPAGQTIDAFVGNLPEVRRDTPFDVLRLGINRSFDTAERPAPSVDFGTCAFGPRQAAPMVMKPAAAFELLFGSVAAASGGAFQRRGNVLDFLVEDIRAAEREFLGSSRERQKLEQYLRSIEEVSARHAKLTALEGELSTLVEAQGIEAALSVLGPDTGPLARLNAQFQLATAALIGELTNVVVLGSGCGGSFDLLYSSVNNEVSRHDMHHQSALNDSLRRDIHEVTRRQVNMIVEMARNLENTPDPAGGTMLDHTVMVFIGDNGEQHHAQSLEFPVLVLGGSALGLRTGGRTVVFPRRGSDTHRQVSNLWNTVGHLAGQDLNTFGMEGEARIAPGPLSALAG